MGAKVWVLRQRSGTSDDKLRSRWIPAHVRLQNSDHVFTVLMKDNRLRKVHIAQIKPHIESIDGESWPMHFEKDAEMAGDDLTAADHWIVYHIDRHRVGDHGEYEFLTKWQGYGDEDATWEPAKSFLPSYNVEFSKYFKGRKLKVDVFRDLGQRH